MTLVLLISHESRKGLREFLVFVWVIVKKFSQQEKGRITVCRTPGSLHKGDVWMFGGKGLRYGVHKNRRRDRSVKTKNKGRGKGRGRG